MVREAADVDGSSQDPTGEEATAVPQPAERREFTGYLTTGDDPLAAGTIAGSLPGALAGWGRCWGGGRGR